MKLYQNEMRTCLLYNYCSCLLNIFRIKEEGKIRYVEIHANSKQFQLTKTSKIKNVFRWEAEGVTVKEYVSLHNTCTCVC